MHAFPLAGFLDVFAGLPVHPLVVHFAVVVLPLAAVAQIVLTIVPAWRTQWATPVLIAMAAGTVSAIVAKVSGEALATHLGTPKTHAQWGDILAPVAVALFVVTAVWWFLQRKAGTSSSAALKIAQVVSAGLAAGVAVLTVLAGHSGAEAAWGGRITSTGQASATASAAPTSASSSTPSTSSTAASYTMATVASHKTASSCWTAINGSVYDLTAWVGEHPGGPSVIEGLCGIDGSAAFSAQHGGDQQVLSRLSTFKLGSLSG